ncbi:arginase family protein [Candidatus Woesearchaeota archaeon]|nr:arginase family protein [Candidatus Woesearchaeota archaeon]
MKILKVPFGAGAMTRKQGLERGPDSVIRFLDAFCMNESGLLPLYEVEDVEVYQSNIGASHEAAYRAVSKLCQDKEFFIVLGGDHSITHPSFKAFANHNPGAGFIVFDAHPDVESHHQPPTHEDYLRTLIDDGVVDADKVILVGTRNSTKDEKRYLEEKKIKNYTLKEISFEGVREVCDSIMSVARQWPKAYLSVDIDVLDPAFAPGTGYPEPGGLTSRELIYLIQRLKLMRNIGMADLVEVNPEKDVGDVTSKLAAKLIIELS